jgi:hypothetical protein
MLKYKVVKLDKRHTGGEYFKYMIEYRRSRDTYHNDTLRFHDVSNWCHENFGYSNEIDMWLYWQLVSQTVLRQPQQPITKEWAYMSSNYRTNLRIYIRDNESLSHLIISHLDIGQ